MNKKYKVELKGSTIGFTYLEFADPSMGVVFGPLHITDEKFNYSFFKNYSKDKKLELACDYPEDKLISFMTLIELKVTSPTGVEIKGTGNQISIMDKEDNEISLFGLSESLMIKEFSHHL